MDNFKTTLPALFPTFVMGLSSAALIEMGVIENPQTKKKTKNKEAAQSHIELLIMLQEKTRGNLSPEEKQLLDQVITDLKLQFAKTT